MTLQAILETGTDRWIRQSREARGWSQQRLARLLEDELHREVSIGSIRNWEAGRFEPPLRTFVGLQQVFRRHRPVKRPTTRQTLPQDQLRSTGALTPRSPLRLAWLRLAA